MGLDAACKQYPPGHVEEEIMVQKIACLPVRCGFMEPAWHNLESPPLEVSIRRKQRDLGSASDLSSLGKPP